MKAKRDTKFCSVLLRKIPRALRGQFKAHCARREIGMSERIVQLMREAVDRDNKAITGGITAPLPISMQTELQP